MNMTTLFTLLAFINIGVWIVLLAVTVIRFTAEHHWRRRWFHDCGFHTEHTSDIEPVCRGCGQSPAVVSENKIMRATFWWGWEEKT